MILIFSRGWKSFDSSSGCPAAKDRENEYSDTVLKIRNAKFGLKKTKKMTTWKT
jgi:hypothetical protein